MKKITLLLAAVLFVGSSFAQDYKNSIGIRLGSGYYDVAAVAFKTFITQPGALEFDLGFDTDKFGGNRYTSAALSGTYQHHFPIGNIQGFKWFVGGGATLSNTFVNNDDLDGGFNVGIYPTGGVDYKLKNAPFAFSADIRPTVHIVNGYDYRDGFYANGGVTARYTF
ncbi:hypothetical protein [Sphingobacterium pedocola]|uniref:Outer membrane protein beta-barrel domain-containing protein n=1 Tax=Sphingobacterium pedocola TaxID=2082722 RepID=A0ABR9TDG6_9SPHI|nr:hypothetical protein [Sphingobacterium pedocola]MBE8723310.1 hypothetical protein [Sphingobacterium pedocola]